MNAVAGVSSSAPGSLLLSGVRVLEMGQLIAGPFGCQLLGYVLDTSSRSRSDIAYSQFGAEVIKIEPPGIGDPLRMWRELDVDGMSP